MPANRFVESAERLGEELGTGQQLFVRPDSPLKPFSGRVIDACSITLASLDFGFYFDDETLPVIVAPVVDVTREWRFIVVRSEVITGCAYDSSTRSASSNSLGEAIVSFAQKVASSIPSPADVYVLDLCESQENLYLLELNSFGGADLYACDSTRIVEAISDFVSESSPL